MSLLRCSVIRAAVAGAVETVGAFLIAFANPFHIDEWVFERNQGVWQRIMADGYECSHSHLDWRDSAPCDWLGRPNWPKPNARASPSAVGPKSPPITVFYLDEASLDSRGTDAGRKPPPSGAATAPFSHTLSLTEQQDLLEDVARARMDDQPAPKPIAVFVDILFDDVVPDEKSAAEVAPWLALSDDAGRASIQGRIDRKLASCAAPKPNDPAPDHFGCYVAHVADITYYSRWAGGACRRSSLTKLACILRAGGVPILFADARSLEDEHPSIPETLAMRILGKVAITAPAMIEGLGYPLVPDGSDGRPLDARALTRGNYQLSPSALLYAAYCLDAEAAERTGLSRERIARPEQDRALRRCPLLPVVSSGTSIDDDESNRVRGWDIASASAPTMTLGADSDPTWDSLLADLHWAPAFGRRLDVLWGIGDDRPGLHGPGTFQFLLDRLHDINLNGSNGRSSDTDRCRSATPELLPRLGRVLREALPIFAGPRDDKPCRYVPTLPATDLDNALTNADKVLLLDHKIVLIGGHYQKSGDWMPALETAVPGVQYHAMALANLMDRNRAYRPIEHPVISGSSFVIAAWPTFVAIFAVDFGVAIAIMALNEPKLDPALLALRKRQTKRLLRRGRMLWLFRAIFVAAPASLFVSAFAFRMTTLHYLNLTVILALLGVATLKLSFAALRPLLEEGRAIIRCLDVSNARLFGPDREPRPPTNHEAKTRHGDIEERT